ncbi:MAG: PHP domain-containing protein [Myxococcota bacterium]
MNRVASKNVLAELHTHSTASDGQYAPGALMVLCKRSGVEVVSLTDHDTVAGCAQAKLVAEELGMTFLTGIEVSAQAGRSIHILGYGVRLDDEDFSRVMDERRQLRLNRMERMIERACALGMEVTMEDVVRFSGEGNKARPHLARALVARGYIGSVAEAFERYLGDGKPVHVPSPWPTVPDAIAEIHAAGGIAVLAHPGLYDMDEHIEGWIDAGLDGIEVHHPDHSASTASRYLTMALRRGLLTTGSSDFHGPAVKSGQVLGQTHVRRDWIDDLLERTGATR